MRRRMREELEGELAKSDERATENVRRGMMMTKMRVREEGERERERERLDPAQCLGKRIGVSKRFVSARTYPHRTGETSGHSREEHKNSARREEEIKLMTNE